jgi:hypothetical protein
MYLPPGIVCLCVRGLWTRVLEREFEGGTFFYSPYVCVFKGCKPEFWNLNRLSWASPSVRQVSRMAVTGTVCSIGCRVPGARDWSGYSLIPKLELEIKELIIFFVVRIFFPVSFFSDMYHTSRPILISTTCTIRSVLVVEKSIGQPEKWMTMTLSS